MSYVALYRKFRPASFEDVKGQDAIVRALRNQVNAGRVGHAYLFCGTRGTGKTSVAKIMAKAVNCEHPVNGSPCGQCPLCRSIADGSSMNVIEIDAASNNGVDHVRDLKEQVAYAPTEGKYKVFIIDEVHMLSASAFNALLKTLEEPPSYVIFILATTEAHRIPITILSRCQRYDFQRISVNVVHSRLAELTQREGIKAQEEALEYLSRAADGSMRDALSLLDQCISFYPGEELTYDGVLKVLGAVDEQVFDDLLHAVLREDAPAALSAIDRIVEEGRDLTQFTADMSGFLRNLLMIRAGADAEGLVVVTNEKKEQLRETAKLLTDAQLIRYIRIFSELGNTLRYSTSKRLDIEVAVIKLCRPQAEQDNESLIARIDRLEKQIAQLKSGASASDTGGEPGGITRSELDAAVRTALQDMNLHTAAQPRSAGGGSDGRDDADGTKRRRQEKAPLPKAIPEDIRKAAGMWKQIVSSMSYPLRGHLEKGKLTADADACRLILVYSDETAYEGIKDRMGEVKEHVSGMLKKEIPISAELKKDHMTETRIDLEALFPGIEIEVEDLPFR